MEKKIFEESELIINSDGSVFHLHLLPEQLADNVILVGDPGRVPLVAAISNLSNAIYKIVNSALSQVCFKGNV